MYLGKIVEITETKELHANPAHPYTRALLSAIPAFDPKINRTKHRIILEGEIPNPLTPPERLRVFHPLSLCEGNLS